MVRIAILSVVSAIVLSLTPLTVASAQEFGCCHCVTCLTNPLASGTEKTCLGCHGAKECTGAGCAHGGCENIVDCGGGEGELLFATSQNSVATVAALANWAEPFGMMSSMPRGLELRFHAKRSAVVMFNACGQVRGMVPVSGQLAARLAYLLPSAETVAVARVAARGADF